MQAIKGLIKIAAGEYQTPDGKVRYRRVRYPDNSVLWVALERTSRGWDAFDAADTLTAVRYFAHEGQQHERDR